MRILVTNDDGISSPGLAVLASAARSAGHDVVVAAPATEYSGMSAALAAVTDQGRVVIDKTHDGYAVAAAPAFIVVIAVLGAFGPPPDLVLSGINPGANAGRAVLHSGTVGAALTAAARGCHAMAVSLDYLAAQGETRHWDTAGRVAGDLLDRAVAAPPGTALNLNVPNQPSVSSLREARLAAFGQVQIQILESGDGYIRTDFLQTDDRPAPGTDLALLAEGHATLTLLRPPAEVADPVIPHQRRPAADNSDLA